jgi:hypothetical protein
MAKSVGAFPARYRARAPVGVTGRVFKRKERVRVGSGGYSKMYLLRPDPEARFNSPLA